MTTIRQASTPTLIQHGEIDHRVPIPNAYELRQGLEDQGVPVKMTVYKGFGHGLSKRLELASSKTLGPRFVSTSHFGM
jgi:dipeptidyl aminopeptidase/acylaminoacyl peptidase